MLFHFKYPLTPPHHNHNLFTPPPPIVSVFLPLQITSHMKAVSQQKSPILYCFFTQEPNISWRFPEKSKRGAEKACRCGCLSFLLSPPPVLIFFLFNMFHTDSGHVPPSCVCICRPSPRVRKTDTLLYFNLFVLHFVTCLKTSHFAACFTILYTSISIFYVNTARDVVTVLLIFAKCLSLYLHIFTCTYRGTHTQAHMYNQHTRGMATTGTGAWLRGTEERID